MASRAFLAPGERMVFALRQHVLVLARPVLVLLLAAPLTGIGVGLGTGRSNSGATQVFVLALAAVVIARWVIVPFAQWWSTTYTITDQRLVVREGVLTQVGHDVPYRRVTDVAVASGVIERVFGSATVMIETAGEAGALVLQHVPQAAQVETVLFRFVEAAREDDDEFLDDDTDDDLDRPFNVAEFEDEAEFDDEAEFEDEYDDEFEDDAADDSVDLRQQLTRVLRRPGRLR